MSASGVRMVRRPSVKQALVRHGVAPSLPGEPKDMRHCLVWGAKVTDKFCRNDCFCKRGNRAGRDYGSEILTRAQCVKANRP